LFPSLHSLSVSFLVSSVFVSSTFLSSTLAVSHVVALASSLVSVFLEFPPPPHEYEVLLLAVNVATYVTSDITFSLAIVTSAPSFFHHLNV
jgi:hypothetical protein